jgi:hypothetical protein
LNCRTLWWLKFFPIAKGYCNQIFNHHKVYKTRNGLSCHSPIRLPWAARGCLWSRLTLGWPKLTLLTWWSGASTCKHICCILMDIWMWWQPNPKSESMVFQRGCLNHALIHLNYDVWMLYFYYLFSNLIDSSPM